MKTNRNYPLLLASQFLGAFGDNAILAIIIGQLTPLNHAGKLSDQNLQLAVAFYTSILFVPYVLLGPLAGFLNDRYAKTRWLMGGNLIKLLGTALGTAAVMLATWQPDSFGWNGAIARFTGLAGVDLQSIGYLIVGVGACVYSPAKYGILPEILPTERLVKANGTVEMLTLVAILLGTVTGATMIDRLSPLVCYGLLLGLYGASWLLNLCMTTTPSDPTVRCGASVAEFAQHGRVLLTSGRLSRMLIGTTLFWFSGAVMKMNFQPWGLKTLGLENNQQCSILGVWLAVGVMLGSVVAGQLYKVGDLRHVRQYGWAMALMTFLLGCFTQYALVAAILICTGLTAGLFLIPLNAGIQAESDPRKLGKTIAIQNFLENLIMCVAGGFVIIAAKAGLSSPKIFIALACLSSLVVIWLRIPRKETPK